MTHQVCCRCQDSRALCNNDLARPVDVVDLREGEQRSSSTTTSIPISDTGTTSSTSTNLGSSTTTCDPLFGTDCDDDILFGSSEDYLDPVNEDYNYDSNPNDSVDPADIDYVEPSGGGGSKKVQNKCVMITITNVFIIIVTNSIIICRCQS